MERVNDFSRQQYLFDNDLLNKDNTPVHVIGCGATGSWVAMTLAKMGIANIHLYDFDVVEEHNLPNQCFGLGDVGKNKAEALAEAIKASTGLEPTVHPTKVTAGTQINSGYVFILVDSMKSRAEIFATIRFRFGISGIIETRTGLDLCQVYTLGNETLKHTATVKRYTDTLHSDDVAETSLCGTSQMVLTTTLVTASYAVRAMISLAKGVAVPLETHIGLGDLNIVAF